MTVKERHREKMIEVGGDRIRVQKSNKNQSDVSRDAKQVNTWMTSRADVTQTAQKVQRK
jgi:hypothetical protein